MAAVLDTDVWDEMEATSGGTGGPFEVCPAGNHAGTIVAVIDMGTHSEDVEDDDGVKSRKDFRKIAVVFEVAKKQSNGKPFVLGLEFNWSFGTRSNFRKFVESATGHKFADGEKFAPPSLLGLPVMVQVVNSTSKNRKGGENTYANVQTVSQFPEGFPHPAPTHEKILFSVKGSEFFQDREWLPRLYGKTIKSMIDASAEVRGRQRDSANGYTSPPPAAPEDDEVPY